jgi:hypothetical protein
MDNETVQYILTYFSHLMTDDETLALKYHRYTHKTADNPEIRRVMMERGWINDNPEILALLSDGYEAFEKNVALRILTETPEKVFFNHCPRCGKLARTPRARQCRHCSHRWHDLIVAQFRLDHSLQLNEQHFYLFGQMAKGEAKPGQWIDLTPLGINKRIQIEVMNAALKRYRGIMWEFTRLGTSVLTEDEKVWLKAKGAFETPLEIIEDY